VQHIKLASCLVNLMTYDNHSSFDSDFTVNITSSAAIGMSSVAVATLLVKAVQKTAMHDTRNTIAAGGNARNCVKNSAMAFDNSECYNSHTQTTDGQSMRQHFNTIVFQIVLFYSTTSFSIPF